MIKKKKTKTLFKHVAFFKLVIFVLIGSENMKKKKCTLIHEAIKHFKPWLSVFLSWTFSDFPGPVSEAEGHGHP